MKKPFLKIWQYSRETPVLESSFRPATLLKRDSNTVFPVNIGKFLRTPILKNICERLLLYKTFDDGKFLSPYKVTYQKNVFFLFVLTIMSNTTRNFFVFINLRTALQGILGLLVLHLLPLLNLRSMDEM